MSKIVRVKKSNNFVVLDKTFLVDKKLSWKAKGILAFMLSKPDNWTFYLDELIKHATDGKHSFRTGFKELIDNGYVKRYPIRKDNRIVRWETVVLEKPLLSNFQEVENQEIENQEVKNQTLLNIDNTNNDSTNNDNNIYTQIFEHWNSKNIIKHRKMTKQMIAHINARLMEYSEDELIKAIDNYKNVLESNEHYWTYKWTLTDFLKPNNVCRFINEADPLRNFLKKTNKGNEEVISIEENHNPDKDAF